MDKILNTINLLTIALLYFLAFPTWPAAIVVATLGIAHGAKEMVQSFTNKELANQMADAIQSVGETDQLCRDRINRFVATYNMPLARLGMQVNSDDIIGQ